MIKTINKTSYIPENEYVKIKSILPIACVDLLVINNNNELLLLKRNNEPAKNQWWTPGGRIHFGETRIEAAKRKLKEECGISSNEYIEIGTYDLIIPFSDNKISHAISTVYKVQVTDKNVVIDNQSHSYKWQKASVWKKELQNNFIISLINKTFKSNERI